VAVCWLHLHTASFNIACRISQPSLAWILNFISLHWPSSNVYTIIILSHKPHHSSSLLNFSCTDVNWQIQVALIVSKGAHRHHKEEIGT
jgi:hypothetical protein